jgi:hypothetical protein
MDSGEQGTTSTSTTSTTASPSTTTEGSRATTATGKVLENGANATWPRNFAVFVAISIMLAQLLLANK